MEVAEFQQAREKQLKDFKSQYDGLKNEYTEKVMNAMKAPDRPTQCVLVQEALDTNKTIQSFLKSFSSNVDPQSCKDNPTLLQMLQRDLTAYTQEHESIVHGHDQLGELSHSISRVREKTQDITSVFSWYAILLVISMGVLFYLIFISGVSRSYQPSMPIFPGRLG